MKYLLSLIFVSLILAGCGKSPKKNEAKTSKNQIQFDSSDVQTTPVKNPDEKFVLKYNFQKGKTYHYRLTTIAHSKKTIHADTVMHQNVDQQITYLMDFDLNDIDKDNIMELNCNITSINLKADANGKQYTYQSGTKLDSIDNMRYADYESLVENPFSLRVTPEGEITEVFRVDKIIAKFLDIRGVADSASSQEKDALRQQMINGALKPLLTQIFRQMPGNSIAKDSAWTHTQAPSTILIYKLQNINTYKVRNLAKFNDDEIAVLDAGLKTKITGKDTYNNRGVSYQFQKPTTSANGKIYFNVSKGLIQKAKTHTIVNIAFTMEMPTPKGKQKGDQNEKMVNDNIVELL